MTKVSLYLIKEIMKNIIFTIVLLMILFIIFYPTIKNLYIKIQIKLNPSKDFKTLLHFIHLSNSFSKQKGKMFLCRKNKNSDKIYSMYELCIEKIDSTYSLIMNDFSEKNQKYSLSQEELSLLYMAFNKKFQNLY